jgi:hypothetical protein
LISSSDHDSALPDAESAAVPDAPPVSDEFAGLLQRFCLASG